MTKNTGHMHPEDVHGSGEPACRQSKGARKVATAAKAARAVSAIVFFGIPVVVGTATVLGYGIHRVYQWTTGRS